MDRLHLPRLANRWRITLWIVVSVLLVTFLIGLIAVSQVKSKFTGRIDDELLSQAHDLAAALEVLDPGQFEELLADDPASISDNTYGVVIVQPDGTTLAVPSGAPDDPDPEIDLSPQAVGSLRGQAGAPFDLESADGSATYRAVVQQLDDGGMVVVTRPLADRDDAVRTVVGVLLLTGAIAAALISVTVAVVTSLVTRPLDSMIDTAEAIGEGDLTSRVPTTGVDDVSRLATALNQMLDRLQQAFAETRASEDVMRRFVADASHELRTPLAAILGYAELIQSGMAGDQAQVERAVARILAEGERMRLIVDELLTLARLDEGRPQPHRPVDVVDLVRQSVADARAIDPARSVELDATDASASVLGDPMSLRQVIDNLLANTRVHTPPGTAVRVGMRRLDGEVVLTVADDGPGMSPEVAAHVFDRFYRVDGARSRTDGASRGGAGLGLAIVAAIVAAHDGVVEVDSAPGQGSTFTVRLPAVAR
jgi:two-component system OmpR family sensor kinase